MIRSQTMRHLIFLCLGGCLLFKSNENSLVELSLTSDACNFATKMKRKVHKFNFPLTSLMIDPLNDRPKKLVTHLAPLALFYSQQSINDVLLPSIKNLHRLNLHKWVSKLSLCHLADFTLCWHFFCRKKSKTKTEKRKQLHSQNFIYFLYIVDCLLSFF